MNRLLKGTPAVVVGPGSWFDRGVGRECERRKLRRSCDVLPWLLRPCKVLKTRARQSSGGLGAFCFGILLKLAEENWGEDAVREPARASMVSRLKGVANVAVGLAFGSILGRTRQR